MHVEEAATFKADVYSDGLTTFSIPGIASGRFTP